MEQRFKIGDLVRTTSSRGFGISGRITSISRLRGIRFADVDTGGLYSRRIPLDNLRMIETCDYTDWIKSESGEFIRVERCSNPPEIQAPGGWWICQDCDRKRQG